MPAYSILPNPSLSLQWDSRLDNRSYRGDEVPCQWWEWQMCWCFSPTEVQKYYKFRDPEERLNTNFVVKFYEFHDRSRLMASWWKEDKKFTNRINGWYETKNIKEPYIHLMALIFWLYGEKDCTKFLKVWIPLTYTVDIFGNNFNWG